MRPVGVCPVATYLIRRRVYLICRGGIHASRQGCAPHGVYGKNDRFPHSVGRGLDPAVDGCLMIPFSGNVAAPAPCVIRFGSFTRRMSSFLTGQKGSEKPAANSEARGTAKGACGPLWKPRGFKGVARDGLRSSQGKGSLLQYRFFPAGTAHPGSRSETPPAFAGGPVCGKHLLYPFAGCSRSVRRGRMYAARDRLPCCNGFWLAYAVPGVCRGGIHASRQGFTPRGVCGKYDRFPYPVGRAFTPAAH